MVSEKFEPGAAKYGNFINYYTFHDKEERTKWIPFADLSFDEGSCVAMLDVGCNTGELTTLLHEGISQVIDSDCHGLAVDIDPVLIERAKELNENPLLSYDCADITSSDFIPKVLSFLSPLSKNKFDVIFLFSVTMWIHLNVGDDGLISALENLCRLTKMVVVEPQPWKCYKSAVRRMKRANKEDFAFFKQLSMRENIENDICNILSDKCGFVKIYESERTKWGRKIMAFINKDCERS